MHKPLEACPGQDSTQRNAVHIALHDMLVAPLAKHGYVFQIHAADDSEVDACAYAAVPKKSAKCI